MSEPRTSATPLIIIDGLPGVARVENISNGGEPAMKVVFVDGVEATVVRALVNKNLFDIWLPPDRLGFAASVVPNIDEKVVMAELSKMASKATTNA